MITYKKAGVNINAGNALVERIKKFAPKIGGFSDGLALPRGLKDPILVGCTDGVGTKLAIAQALNKHDNIGYDLVGMNVNDLICSGAKPLFFLDYYACGKLDVKRAEKVIKSIGRACRESDCQLLGGETAEMPGFYKPGEYDLAGFAVGVVSKKDALTPKKWVKPGDLLVGLPSSGLHSNGYSLVRRVFSKSEWRKYAKELLTPTKLYVRDVLRVLKALNRNEEKNVKGLVHITGGGFIDNIPRVLPKWMSARIWTGSWPIPQIFQDIQIRANLSQYEMFRTFNMGIGMVLVVAASAVKAVQRHLPSSFVMGDIIKGHQDVRFE